ncbi:glycosyltransferase family 2 protein [Agromyces atrinae]|uniref:glycosyltransferase family 2 protein n=1 Tax=Agromyces atrinae TaxID=592376 RepID=UPI001F57EA1A|nr:glycosyltransferase family A protein [Agromyces atrinae]MCI2956073.1 glycosyltransferase family 2 protein [Agromyces atrinae]
MTTVSCVVPTHLRTDYLGSALRSVVAQSLPPDEIIVVSDVVDDVARAECEVLATSSGISITYVESPPGQSGAASSRNVGAATSTGDLIAFLDDDDLWAPDYLQRAVERLKDSGSELVVTWLEEFSEERRRPGESISAGLRAQDAAAMNPGATGSNIVVTRQSFDRVGGFDPALRVKNDTDFLFRFLRSAGTYSVVEERLVLQRKHQSGQLTAKTEMRAAGTELYLAKHMAHLTAADVRTLRLYIHRIRSHSAKTGVGRVYNMLSMARYYSLSELLQRLRRGRDTTYIEVKGFTNVDTDSK